MDIAIYIKVPDGLQERACDVIDTLLDQGVIQDAIQDYAANQGDDIDILDVRCALVPTKAEGGAS